MLRTIQQTFKKSPIVWMTTLTGVLLIALALVFHVNPVEGSVMPRWMTTTIWGNVVYAILMAAAIPAWVVYTLLLRHVYPANTSDTVILLSFLVTQVAVFYSIGKTITALFKRVSRRV